MKDEDGIRGEGRGRETKEERVRDEDEIKNEGKWGIEMKENVEKCKYGFEEGWEETKEGRVKDEDEIKEEWKTKMELKKSEREKENRKRKMEY